MKVRLLFALLSTRQRRLFGIGLRTYRYPSRISCSSLYCGLPRGLALALSNLSKMRPSAKRARTGFGRSRSILSISSTTLSRKSRKSLNLACLAFCQLSRLRAYRADGLGSWFLWLLPKGCGSKGCGLEKPALLPAGLEYAASAKRGSSAAPKDFLGACLGGRGIGLE